MFDHNTLDLGQFMGGESPGSIKFNWFQPELCQHSLTSNMNVWRLIVLIAVEEESIASYSRNDRHRKSVYDVHLLRFAPNENGAFRPTFGRESPNRGLLPLQRHPDVLRLVAEHRAVEGVDG